MTLVPIAKTPTEVLPLAEKDDAAQSLFWQLQRKLEFTRETTAALNDVYENDAALQQLGLAIPPELRD